MLTEANDAGNLKKLSEPASVPARHLCVVVEPTVGRAYSALRHGQPGVAPSALPWPITTVWALADQYVAWITPPAGAWNIARIIDRDVFDHPERLLVA